MRYIRKKWIKISKKLQVKNKLNWKLEIFVNNSVLIETVQVWDQTKTRLVESSFKIAVGSL
jgi:predicted nucleic-acid-binding protein